jgi:hypothetical protein
MPERRFQPCEPGHLPLLAERLHEQQQQIPSGATNKYDATIPPPIGKRF